MQAYWQHKAAVKAAAEERLRMSLYKSCGKVPSYRRGFLLWAHALPRCASCHAKIRK